MTATGTRLVDLARELKLTNAELVTTLQDLGVRVSGLHTMMDGETVATIRGLLSRPPGQRAPAPRPAAATPGVAPGAQAPTAAPGSSAPSPPPAAPVRVAEVTEDATLRDLAQALGVQPSAAQRKLADLGELAAVNQRLSTPLAEQLAEAYGFTLRVRAAPKVAPAKIAAVKRAVGAGAQTRPPVVTIMGHVDHGKTTLLDFIRQTHVVEGEHGGITQHIGAYQVEVEHDGEKRKITFLDTPGHKAFTAMRARGASVTDIVVLVVAADDGIMPQTVEAINHAQAAAVPMIVAVNKIDLPDAQPDRIKLQLTEHNVVVEDYGGDTIAVPLSAKTGDGVKNLLEYILLVSDIQELKADPNGQTLGTVIEARVEAGRGPVSTILVQNGTLKVGDSLVAGITYGKVRAMVNDRGERLQKAGPAMPVEVTGLDSAPIAGDLVEVVKNERDARTLAEERSEKQRSSRLSGSPTRVTLADLFEKSKVVATKDMNVIVKADVQGSLEAVVGQLHELEANKKEEEVCLSIKHSGIGNVNESDILLGEATGAVIVGFNVRVDTAAQRAAERAGVDVRLYTIIYDLVEDMDRAMKGMLTPIFEESGLGRAEVRQVFRTPRGLYIAGCYVQEGKIVRGAQMRVRRGKDVLFTGRIDSLRHIKDDVREMAAGFECGLTIEGWNDYKVGDILECFEMKQIMRV